MAGVRTIQGADTLAASRPYLNDNFAVIAGLFAGSTAPSPTYPYMLWADTNAQVLKQRNSADDAWLILGQLGQNYLGLLPLSGGTLTGPIDMDGYALTGLPEGVNATDAARVQELNLKANIDGPAFTGDATINQDPAGNNSLIRRSWANAQYMTRAGGTFVGAVLGVTSADAAAFLPRSVIERLTSFHPTTGHRHTGSDAGKVRGTDLDSTGGAAGQALRATAGSAAAWGPMLPGEMRFGTVSAVGAILRAGSGDWTSAIVSGSRIRVTFTGGMASTPSILVTSERIDPYDGSTIYTISVSTASFDVVQSDYGNFSFLAFC